jgi:hypothetical protein
LKLARAESIAASLVETLERFGLIYMIRTGSGVGPDGTPETGFAPAMLARWKRITGGGYSLEGRLHRPNGRGPVSIREEEDVFRELRMAWVPPEQRVSAAAVDRAAEAIPWDEARAWPKIKSIQETAAKPEDELGTDAWRDALERDGQMRLTP